MKLCFPPQKKLVSLFFVRVCVCETEPRHEWNLKHRQYTIVREYETKKKETLSSIWKVEYLSKRETYKRRTDGKRDNFEMRWDEHIHRSRFFFSPTAIALVFGIFIFLALVYCQTFTNDDIIDMWCDVQYTFFD